MFEIDRFRLIFKSKETEMAYRAGNLAEDKTWSAIFMGLLTIPMMLFLILDKTFLGGTPIQTILFALRIFFVILSIGCIAYFIFFPITAKIRERIMIGWWILLIILIFIINSTRPTDYLLFTIMDTIIILLIYLVSPLYFTISLFLALTLTAGDFITLLYFKSGYSQTEMNIHLISYLFVTIVGISALRRLHLTQRLKFAAIQNVKTLSGLLPICSHCKKIQDDQGYWSRIESYISDHSEAEFTHGICKECATKYYPDIDLSADV